MELPAITTALFAARYYVLAIVITGFAAERLLVYRRLRYFKGPPLGSISFLWLLNAGWSGDLPQKLALVCEKYGAVARVGPNLLVTADPDILRRMSSARSRYIRSRWYEVLKLSPHLHNLISEPDEARHQDLRTKVAAGYSGKENATLEETVDKHILEFIHLIESKYISEGTDVRPANMARMVQYFTLDAITDIAFGEPFGDLPADDDVHKYIETNEAMSPAIHLAQVVPGGLSVLRWIHRNRWVSPLTMPSYGDKTGFGEMTSLGNRIVSERYSSDEKETGQDQLSSFIRHGLTQEEAEGESLLQIAAGSDTTAGAIRVALISIISQPGAYTRLQSEISQASQANQISHPVIRTAQARTLPYLQACIKESLRIYPPVVGTFSKLVPPGGDILDGKFVPAGTEIAYCAYGVHRNKSTFGADASCFRPERWLEATPEQLLRMDQAAGLHWGHGRYGCLGKNLALMEINKVLVEVRSEHPPKKRRSR